MDAERYRIPVFEREAPLLGGEEIQLTRFDVEPSAAEDAFEATIVPWLAEPPGFRSVLLFADLASGHLFSEMVWRDPRARAASPGAAAVMRAGALDAANGVIGAVEDCILVFSSARKA